MSCFLVSDLILAKADQNLSYKMNFK